MPYKTVTVSKYGTEADFVSEFIKSFMAESVFISDHTLLCKINSVDLAEADLDEADTLTLSNVDTKVSAIYANSGRPYIWFVIDDAAILKFFYDVNASKWVIAIYFYRIFDKAAFVDHHGGTTATTTATRVWKYQIVSNANVLCICVGDYQATLPLTYQVVFIYKNNNDFFCGGGISSTLRGANLEQLTAVDRLEYINDSNDTTAIETIQNKVLLKQGDNSKAVTMSNIWDSTYNYFVMAKVTIGNSQYVYLSNYTVMPI